MVEIAAARMPHARVVQGDMPPLPFDDGEFDRVFTSHFFHHLSPDRRAAFIAEARRVGREIVVVEDVRRPDAPAEEWRELVLGDGSHHRMHRHAFTAAELSLSSAAVRCSTRGAGSWSSLRTDRRNSA